MSDYTISSVSRIGQENPESLPVARREESRQVEKKKDRLVEPQKQESGTSTGAAFASFRIQFQVDEKTNDVVIFIRDTETDKVLRTIPADAIKDLPPGQLMDMFY